jgi:hypothetical protein
MTEKPSNVGLPKAKPTGDREALIDWRLEFMTTLAAEQKRLGWNEVEEAHHNKYIRINGESYRAVSLSDGAPLCRFDKSGSPKWGTIQRHFEKNPVSVDETVLEKKRERRLQSRIIKQALIKNRNLLDDSLFGNALKDEFDELLFALDEISFGDANHGPTIRCDLVAVGKCGNDVLPIVIELKSERSLSSLFKELDNASNEIESHHAKFSALLKTVTGMSVSKGAKARKILVWPALDSGRENNATVEKRKESGILFIEYTPRFFTSPDEVIFSCEKQA